MIRGWHNMRFGFAQSVRLMAVLLFVLPFTAQAVAVDDAPLADPQKEARAREIMAGIRCLVCQNQSIEDSNADLARDLRVLVRQQVALGKDRDQVEAFLVARYGDWVLLKPPFNLRTLALWVFPPFLLLATLTGLWIRAKGVRRKTSIEPRPLSEEEKTRLAALLDQEGGQP
ncbi:cytochrome c-type biogenesis protein CcmH [Iodidimonas muriae]|uniref:Cytochrome c-type biogenesis protein n=1 Tax=Iodidimonas muriae TaxID=261467 RepID=A0ABQ2LAK2_9PROT|nr:cytochrome c-type biogenesis protein [Iodidimonas muriae]GGO08473.1 cytochrome c-type biogenesis protein CcmH [Iodidimonas muriae]